MPGTRSKRAWAVGIEVAAAHSASYSNELLPLLTNPITHPNVPNPKNCPSPPEDQGRALWRAHGQQLGGGKAEQLLAAPLAQGFADGLVGVGGGGGALPPLRAVHAAVPAASQFRQNWQVGTECSRLLAGELRGLVVREPGWLGFPSVRPHLRHVSMCPAARWPAALSPS